VQRSLDHHGREAGHAEDGTETVADAVGDLLANGGATAFHVFRIASGAGTTGSVEWIRC
jgi:hypothetical protein